ncbi:MAG: hypothetical protein ACO377_12115 [Pseudomonadales bacterium]
MPRFARIIGIDYSGAATPTSSLSGLRVFMGPGGDHAGDGKFGETEPVEVLPPPGRRKYWSRRGIAAWLKDRLLEDLPTLVGIDHGFSFPKRYFETHGVPQDWALFLEDFHAHWPTDGDDVYVDFVRDGVLGAGAARWGDARWRRLTEVATRRAKSVFHFDVQGSVAKSTHAGIPWLRYLRLQLGSAVQFWPFDGWDIAPGRSVIVEAYPALWSPLYAKGNRTQDQHDAYSIAAWLGRADRNDQLDRFFHPPLSDTERAVAEFEGWILGVVPSP